MNDLVNKAAAQPGAVFVQLNTACNARCVTCPHPFTYGPRGAHARGAMNDAVWNKIIADLRAMDYRGQVGLYLHYEPLLEMTLFDRIRDVNARTGAYVVLSTNGALLTPARRRALIEAGPRQVHINVDSADEKQYEAMMGLPFAGTMERAKAFIAEAAGRVRVEINCPVMPGVDTGRIKELFRGTQVNDGSWANSRGGLVQGVDAAGRGSRFNAGGRCVQPDQNFNILHDGSVIVCCNDWAHESKKDFPNIMDSSIAEIYRGLTMDAIREDFLRSDYGRYRMCVRCAAEMGFVPAAAGVSV